MKKTIKWAGVIAALVLVAACWMPWAVIDSRNLTISGINTHGTSFGKPAYFHFVLVILFLLCLFTAKIWAKRLNLIVGALTIAWALRNLLIVSTCEGGDCPSRQTGIFLVVGAALIMFVAALVPDIELNAIPPKD